MVRALYAMCIVAADAGLILLNLHFASDVIAGTFVGVSTGLFTVALCAAISVQVKHSKTLTFISDETAGAEAVSGWSR